ncbi:hypothetical protein FFI94_017645 [Rhodococcus sp. KBS0724]|uniref:hypothetical protein n=1 Tax=Rhodococcus sp. KBS0724 TaxID=1179674 RepID=UPI00110F2C82|nr:hypothetical protein FFI94_017645 [Rhodococcus sp. KBS0724]
MSTFGKTIATATISAAMIFAGASLAHAAPDSPREAQARAYIDALVSHDVTDVHFAPDATRVEAGIQTGFSGPQLSADLDHGVQYTVIQSVRDLRMTEAGDVVTAVYLLDAGVADTRLMTVEIRETFEIRDGLIHVIVADIMPVSLS